MVFSCCSNRFCLKFFATLAILFFSFQSSAQTTPPATSKSQPTQAVAPNAPPAPPATNKAPAPATATAPVPAATAEKENYEQLLDQYFVVSFENEEFKKGIVKLYRRLPGKSDPKFSYVETPEFQNEAVKVFKEHWKSIARTRFTAAELQYLIIYQKSAVRKKLSNVEFEAYDMKVLGKLFDEIPAKPASPATPPKR